MWPVWFRVRAVAVSEMVFSDVHKFSFRYFSWMVGVSLCCGKDIWQEENCYLQCNMWKEFMPALHIFRRVENAFLVPNNKGDLDGLILLYFFSCYAFFSTPKVAYFSFFLHIYKQWTPDKHSAHSGVVIGWSRTILCHSPSPQKQNGPKLLLWNSYYVITSILLSLWLDNYSKKEWEPFNSCFFSNSALFQVSCELICSGKW